MVFSKIALGGGCHWCTEAVFQSLIGVEKVEQGFVAPKEAMENFSEAVVVTYNPEVITMDDLIEIHLHTHKSTSAHSFRNKYRSAVYTFSVADFEKANAVLNTLQSNFDGKLITKVYAFHQFKPSQKQFQNYYYTDSEKPFCTTYITPKLSLLLKRYAKFTDTDKVAASIAPKAL